MKKRIVAMFMASMLCMGSMSVCLYAEEGEQAEEKTVKTETETFEEEDEETVTEDHGEEILSEPEPDDLRQNHSLGLMAVTGVNSYAALKEAINGQTGEIEVTLNNSFSTDGTEHLTLETGADVTIDLNGCTILADDSGNGALFTVPSGANLTIRDSQADSAVKGDGVAVDAVDAGMLAEVEGSVETGISLTYYVTESTVTNQAIGVTKETRYPYTAHSVGMICTTGQNHALFNVTGGTLNLESGFLYGENQNSGNRAINANAGTIHLSGGFICGFDEAYSSGHGEEYDGGAIRVTDAAILNLSGDTVIAANKAATGGGVDVANGATFNMIGGVISGNEATEDIGTSEWNNDYGGGGVHAYGNGTTVNISGGYLTNNLSDCTGYFDGGGGILLNGATLYFTGGFITGNRAQSGGGIRTAFAANVYQMKSAVYITGGYLCANYATSAEGGGLNLDNGCYGEVIAEEAVYINNNATDTVVHWGGGGIYVANGATMVIEDALITENEAGGFGGGVAGCSTGRIAIADEAGAAIYNNTALGLHTSGDESIKHDDTDYALNDKIFLENGYADYYCALESTVSGMMLGGGAANWHGSADGQVVDHVGINEFLWATYIMGLTADPSEAAISLAQSAAKVYVSGNASYTHGGGILSNGHLFFGTVIDYEIGDALQINADKQLIDNNGDPADVAEGQFTFEVTDENGEVVSTGVTQSDGSIFFNRRLPLQVDGTFTYEIREAASEDPVVLADPTVYILVVTVGRQEKEITVSGIPFDYTYYYISHVTLTKKGENEPLIDQNVTSSEDAITSITIPSPAFVNFEAEAISIHVQKTWQDELGNEVDWPEIIFRIEVTLFQNGKAYQEPVYLTKESPDYTWEYLPTSGEDESGETVRYTYEVREEVIAGYQASYEVINMTDPDQIDNPNDPITASVEVKITNRHIFTEEEEEEDDESSEEKKGAPKTGDQSFLALWLALMSFSAGGIVILYKRRKRLEER